MDIELPQIWNWHPDTRRLIRTAGPCFPDLDPVVEDNLLFPACTTLVEPGPDVTGKEQEFDIEGQAWVYIDAAVPTSTPAVGDSTPEELAQQAAATRDLKLQVAALRISPLQDAKDLGEATAEEEADLLLWKQYRIALNRVSQQPGYPQEVVWPPEPGATA